MGELSYWVALTHVPELGARRIGQLVAHFGSARRAFSAIPEELAGIGLPERVVAGLLEARKTIDPENELRRLARLGIEAEPLCGERYPALLKEIHDPPAVLYYRGDLAVLNRPCIAVVGSRKATEYGKAAAVTLAADLARAETVVVSGMARGIDTYAHLGALQGGGKTAAVLGSGVDVCYPPENRSLREKIVRHGVVLSEFPPGTLPKPAHFPMRNRIISGLSLATVVVEAQEKSGALITADCALEQGRDVFAVPGSINSPASRGCHKLIREGAAVIECAGDILGELGLTGTAERAKKSMPVSAELKKVLDAMEYEPVHFDEVAGRTGLLAGLLSSVLVELELAGLVKKMSGNFYLRV